jgi:hypothetical protein
MLMAAYTALPRPFTDSVRPSVAALPTTGSDVTAYGRDGVFSKPCTHLSEILGLLHTAATAERGVPTRTAGRGHGTGSPSVPLPPLLVEHVNTKVQLY